MQLLLIPFHDWRKNCKEGFRTRDGHFIKEFEKNKDISKILIINRPTTLLEIFVKKLSYRLNGELIKSNRGFKLTKINAKVYVVDYISNDFLGQMIKKYKWFINKYQDPDYIKFVKECIDVLKMNNHHLIIQNVFSGKMSYKLNSKVVLFDAWDNFLKFPAYSKIKNELKNLYHTLSVYSELWISNSLENIKFFESNFNINNIRLIKNGVSPELFSCSKKQIPFDLKGIKSPIIGFGGKITYLLDVDLVNYIVDNNPDFSFVFVGQILDNDILKKMRKAKNIYYLGDKHYDDYPDYVKNFDVSIIPYQIKNKQHGGDSIKSYEYLMTGKKVIGTRGNGLEDLEDYLYIADSYEEFSNEIRNYKVNKKEKFNSLEYTWTKKAENILELIKK